MRSTLIALLIQAARLEAAATVKAADKASAAEAALLRAVRLETQLEAEAAKAAGDHSVSHQMHRVGFKHVTIKRSSMHHLRVRKPDSDARTLLRHQQALRLCSASIADLARDRCS